MGTTSTRSAGFRRLRVRVRDGEVAGRLVAEVHDAGASGVEECSETELVIYAPVSTVAAVARAVTALADALPAGHVAADADEPVADTPWEEHWKRGLGVIRASPRLAVRPPFVPDEGAGALVVELGQAFGTGGHASTRVALRALDGLPAEALRGARALDVGTGSGVLALAALRLGAARAVGFDLDPVAAPAARRNAAANDLTGRLALFTGTLAALHASFDVVLANLLRTELEPLLSPLLASVRPGGYAILAGLLDSDRDVLAPALARGSGAVTAEVREVDADGTCWIGLSVRCHGPRDERGPAGTGSRTHTR